MSQDFNRTVQPTGKVRPDCHSVTSSGIEYKFSQVNPLPHPHPHPHSHPAPLPTSALSNKYLQEGTVMLDQALKSITPSEYKPKSVSTCKPKEYGPKKLCSCNRKNKCACQPKKQVVKCQQSNQ